jgi:uncharacterized protein
MKRVLSIDGGGLKGVFPAAFLAAVEDTIGRSASDYFDLIVGTSTGGIIALAIGSGIPAKDILSFYESEGPKVFAGSRIFGFFRHWGRAKYNPEPLREALTNIFGDRHIGDCTKRLVIPSFNLETGEVYIWKTAHHPTLQRDYKCRIVDAAMSTSAAPTYFPTHRTASGVPLLDGGVWANNPVAVAAVEAIGVLGWPREEVRILSIGCTSNPLAIDWARRWSQGKFYWAAKVVDLFIYAQQASANGMAEHLLGDRTNFVRICPAVGNPYYLDRASDILLLRGLGESEARKQLPKILPIFFSAPTEDVFEPVYKIQYQR